MLTLSQIWMLDIIQLRFMRASFGDTFLEIKSDSVKFQDINEDTIISPSLSTHMYRISLYTLTWSDIASKQTLILRSCIHYIYGIGMKRGFNGSTFASISSAGFIGMTTTAAERRRLWLSKLG